MINTNGIRLARDPAFLEAVAEWKHRAEIYLQFDSFEDTAYRQLRGESLVETKLRAIDALGAAGMRTILVCTVQSGVNENEVGKIVQFAQKRPWITGASFQPASKDGSPVPLSVIWIVTHRTVRGTIMQRARVEVTSTFRIG